MSEGKRRILMYVVPLLAAILVAVFWAYSGRYISTDNAYVKTAQVHISPEVAGIIEHVLITENQRVNSGDVLFRINEAPFLTTITLVEAELNSVRMDIETLRAVYHKQVEELELAKENLSFYRREYDRQADLAAKGVNAKSQLDEALHRQYQAEKTNSVIREEIKQLLVGLQGDPNLNVENHPRYQAALARLERAKLDLANASIKSPIDGIATMVPEVGEYVDAGKPVMSLVSAAKYWVEANFMETALTKVVPGLPVKIQIDTYPDMTWQGTVESISPATGAEFAILPPQNATGNWVKITQRIPVRISLEVDESGPLLRKGMTVEVEIDTGSYH